MSRICLYYKHLPESDRWIFGDRYVRPLMRRLVRGKPRAGGLDKVFINLCLGLDKLGIEYSVNLPFNQIQNGDRIGILGIGKPCLQGYKKSNPIVAGIGLMTHPSEWSTLCEDYPVVRYLQHSTWANDVYKPYFGDRCHIWPVGIDTEKWQDNSSTAKTIDFLIYNKIMWNYEENYRELLTPIQQLLTNKGLTFTELRYGSYHPQEYQKALEDCRSMIFLCEHESQGIAYQECLSSNVPILAWDQGEWLDPNRFVWGTPHIPATSVPCWDDRCGVKFQGIHDFSSQLDIFLDNLNAEKFAPRDYILENLTLEKCAQNFIEILNSAIA